MKRKLLISLGLALMLTMLVAVGAMAADKLVIAGYETTTVGFDSAAPGVSVKSSGVTATGVEFSAKPAKYADINATTGVLTGKKAGKVTVTAKYTTPEGKTIKGTKSVKIVANVYKGKIKKTGWTLGDRKLYFTTKRLYFSADGQYLNAEMWAHNYSGYNWKVTNPVTDYMGYIIDVNTGLYTDALSGVKFIGKNPTKTYIPKKGKYCILFQFPTGGAKLDLASGRYRVYEAYSSTNVKTFVGKNIS